MQRSNNVVLVTGGFDPVHSGHIEYFKAARELGDKLIVGLNSDNWLTRKKGQPFMPIKERLSIVESLSMVDECITFNDSDNSSIDAIKKVREIYPNSTIIFANGGDRTALNVPEFEHKDNNLIFKFGIGGHTKKNSSSWILEEWKHPKTYRQWGWYRVLDDKKTYKIKELIVEPGKSLSMQRHFYRNEHWYVLSGNISIVTIYNNDILEIQKGPNETYEILANVWHQARNDGAEECHILEVQFGEKCIEEDIERK